MYFPLGFSFKYPCNYNLQPTPGFLKEPESSPCHVYLAAAADSKPPQEKEGDSEDDEIWVFEPSRGRGEPSPTTSPSSSSSSLSSLDWGGKLKYCSPSSPPHLMIIVSAALDCGIQKNPTLMMHLQCFG